MGYKVVKVSDVENTPLPGHHNMVIKKIVSPKGVIKDEKIDFGVSVYNPNAHVEGAVHEDVYHIFYLMKGKLTGILDGERREFVEGDVIYIPPGVRHEFLNETSEPAVIVAVIYPPFK